MGLAKDLLDICEEKEVGVFNSEKEANDHIATLKKKFPKRKVNYFVTPHPEKGKYMIGRRPTRYDK